MSAVVIRFPYTRPIENGLTYIVPFDEADREHWECWSLYRQPAGADEPDLVDTFDDYGAAVAAGRQLARRNRDRFIIDEGVR